MPRSFSFGLIVNVPVVFSLFIVAGCGGGNGGSDKPKEWLGPNASLDDVVAAAEELSLEVDAAFLETGDNPTAFDDLPANDSVTYTGLMLGEETPDTGPLVNYAADLTLIVNFIDGTIDGTVRNVATTLEGFDHPSGSIDVVGAVYDEEFGDAGLGFGGSGELVQGELVATYTTPEVFGYFGGSDAQAAAGYQATNFIWTGGPYEGTNSSSDGAFLAVSD